MADRANSTTDVVILQLKIDEGTGKKLPQAKKEVEVLAGSIMGLSKANKALRDERNKLDTSTVEGARRIQELNKAIDKNNQTIKENTSALEKQRLNIGNYGSALDKLMPGLGNIINGQNEIAGALMGTINPLLGVAAGAGALFAAYVKSTTGAKDFAFAQERIAFVTNKVIESFGSLIGGTGSQGSGPLNKALNLFRDFVLAQPGFALLFGGTIKRISDESEAAAKAAERLHDLEISIKLAQAAFKEDERSAELQRRIRDDQTKSLKERLEAGSKIEEFLQAAGARTIVVLQSQIAAIKEHTVNYQNDREAQLKVAEIEAEIADKREEITGKLTENVTSLAAIRKQAAEEQKKRDDEQELRDRRKIDTDNDIIEVAQFRLDRGTEIREQEADIHKRFNQRIVAETKKRVEQENKIEKSGLDGYKAVIDARINLVSTIGQTIGQLAGKNKILAITAVLIEKAAAIAQIISNTAIANAKAIATSPITFGQPWVGINTATAIASGISVAAQAAQSISQISSYAQGGEVKYRSIGGRYHSQGGTKFWGEDGSFFEAERDEGLFIMKRSANKEYLSSLNQAHGGKSWNQKSWYAAQGGQIETRDVATRSLMTSSLSRIEMLLTNQPRPVVFVEDIRTGVNRAVETEVRATKI